MEVRLLIRAKTNGTGPDHWKRNHCVYVAPAGHVFGRLECPPNFYVLDVEGTVDEWDAKLKAPNQIGTDQSGDPIFAGTPAVGVDVDAPAPPARAVLQIPKMAQLIAKVPMATHLETGPLTVRQDGLPIVSM